jgi:hypothetical protein
MIKSPCSGWLNNAPSRKRKTRRLSVFYPIEERGSFIKSYSDSDILDPIVVRVFSNSEGRYKYVIEYKKTVFTFDRGRHTWIGFIETPGPGGMPAATLETPLAGRFPVQKFLIRFLEDTEGLDADVVAWIEMTLRRYAAAGSSVAGVHHPAVGGDA